MSFQVNDKVVCVDDGLRPGGLPSNLQKGATYTVRATECCDGVYVTGVVLERHWHSCGCKSNTAFRELPFRGSRFRKLTDIQAENKQSASNPNAGVVSAYPKGRYNTI